MQVSEEFPSVGPYITSRESVPADLCVQEAVEVFFKNPSLEASAVLQGSRPLGLVTRRKLLMKLFRRYGFELYGRKPVEAVADLKPLRVHPGDPLDQVMEQAMARPEEDIYDEVVVVGDEDDYLGLLSVKQMILQQSSALANIIAQKELARARAKEMERIARVKEQFITHVTHELRSPVNALLELAELMRMSCEKGYLDQMRDRLGLMQSCATNLRSVITNILDLSKIQAGKMAVLEERFPAHFLLEEVADTARLLAGNKPVAVTSRTVPHDLEVYSDPVKVRQVLLNLAGNAAKFTEEGRIELCGEQGDGQLMLSVRDTGIGIREEHLTRLFHAFEQLEDAKEKRFEGTGLGLTICKRLAALLGGEIQVRSRYGEGSVFSLVIPAGEKALSEEEPE